MNNFIPYGRQSISDSDISSVVETLKSPLITQGPIVPKFEEVVSSYCGSKYAVAVNSATSALHISCLALGLSVGDEVWTSPITFVASANCALYCGAKVDFVDIDPGTFNISVNALEKKLVLAQKENRLPKIVIPVHFGGLSCDMKKIHQLSCEFGFKVIEDASHAIGGSYQNKMIGSCQYSDISVFSFHPVKIITSGEGGVALCNDSELSKKLKLLRSHCVTRDEESMENHPDGPWYYEQTGLGYNYRMTDIHAALGLSQFKRLDTFVEKRNEIACRYKQELSSLPLDWQLIPEDCYSSYHLFVVILNNNNIRKVVFEKMRLQNVGVNVHYIPVYRQPFYAKLGISKVDFPRAEKYYESCITLPLFPSLNEDEFSKIVSLLSKLIHK